MESIAFKWQDTETLILNVKVLPGAQKTECTGLADGFLRIKLNAQPQDNAANIALIAFLSKLFKTPKANIQLLSGQKSKYKRLLINAVNQCPIAIFNPK